jgi:arylsulfatase A-like enzyme
LADGWNRAALGLSIVLALTMLPGCPGADPPVPGGPPIILVVVDTLRADHLGAYGYTRDTSPNLDAWSSSGRLFERPLATAPWTAPSFGSLFTGQLPTRHGAVRQERPDGALLFDRLDPGVETVAGILGRRGYATAALVNNPFLSPEFGLDRGFGLYDFHPGSNSEIRRADAMVDLALSWIDAQGSTPFLVVVHLFDPHMNYDAPAPFRGRYTGAVASRLDLPVDELDEIRGGGLTLEAADREFIVAAYDEEIAFVDRELGRFLESLESRGVLDRALLLLTSDHGEELFEHGGFEHGHALWQELMHVPLIVWGPGVRPGREASPVSIADVAPTMLEFAGATPPGGLAGMSLWPHLRDGTPLPERTLYAEQNLYGTELKVALRWPHKLLVNVEEGGRWLFDLEANPAEALLPWDREASVAAELAAALTERVARDLAERSAELPAELGEETLEKLRSLGYVGP